MNVLGGGGGGYDGLVVVTSRPKTFHRLGDELKNPYRIAKKKSKKNIYCGPYMKNGGYFFPLLYIHVCLLCDEVLLPWNCRSPGLKISYQIASLFDMFIDMGERIAGKQDRPSLIISLIIRAPQIAQIIHIFYIWLIYEKLVFQLFPLVVHMSPLWWGLHLLTFRCPCYSWILCKGPTWIFYFFFHIFYFNSKGSYQIASIFDI